jgi:hypothetical protein
MCKQLCGGLEMEREVGNLRAQHVTESMVLLDDFDRCGIRDLRVLRYLHTGCTICCSGLVSLCQRSDARLLAILEYEELKTVWCVHDDYWVLYMVSEMASGMQDRNTHSIIGLRKRNVN